MFWRFLGAALPFALAVAVMAFFMSFCSLHHVYAREWGAAQGKYLAASEADWYRSLKQPDHPLASCCGAGDAYYADDSDVVDGHLYAIITDDRPNEITLDDGKKVWRPPVPVGTRIMVPTSKIRKHGTNPTEHTIIFLAVYGYDEWGGEPGRPEDAQVYCYEPIGGL